MSGKKKKKRPVDINELAASIVADATDGTTKTTEDHPTSDGKNPNAVALGRLGGLKGGKARASKLSPEQRSEIARKAAMSRWKNKK